MTHEKHNPQHCLEMFKKLSEYIDGELDTLTCEELERHVKECIPCKICLMTLKKTVNLCREMDTNPVPNDFSERLREMIESMPRQDRTVQRR